VLHIAPYGLREFSRKSILSTARAKTCREFRESTRMNNKELKFAFVRVDSRLIYFFICAASAKICG